MSANRVLGSAAFLILSLAQGTVGQTIVWTDANARKIQRKGVNGGEVATIVQFPSTQTATLIHYDPIAAKLYYLSGGAPTHFQRSNLDGSNPENITTPTWGTFALNVELRKLYWSNSGVIYRSELNGAGVESHTYGTCCVVTLEPFGDKMFFGSGSALPKGIWRADADGSNEQFLHATGAPMDLAYDPVESKLYVAAGEQIDRINTDGSGFQPIVLNSAPEHVEVDYRARKLYWADLGVRAIRRSNLDGSNAEDFVTSSDVGNLSFDPQGLAIVYNSTPIPTVSDWGFVAMSTIILAAGLLVLRRHNRMVRSFLECSSERRDCSKLLSQLKRKAKP